MPLKNLGRYEVIEELGRGSMGVIYKAFDPLLDRLVALKTVPLDLSREEAEAFERRFQREARSAGRLNHPNIVTIHDVGKTDSVAYIAMEFLQGRSLRHILDSGVVLPIERVVDIAVQVAEGLAFAHESGIVHRDIKPPNIMVLENGAVKITDFGIALIPSGSRTLAGTVFGSPKYMSPEQVVGREIDGRSDVFSLGAVLYEMVTGFAPFFGGDLEAVLYQVINEMPAAPTSRNKALPPAFDFIVTRALAKHPDDRYASARALAADLKNYRKLPVVVAPVQRQRTLERRALRRRKGEIPSTKPVAAAPSALDATPGTAPRKPVPRHLGRNLGVGVGAAFLIFGVAMIAVRALSERPPQAAPATSTTPVLASAIALPTTAPATLASDSRLLATAQSAESAPAKPSVSAPANAASAKPGSSAPAVTAPARARSTEKALAPKPNARLGLAVSPWGDIYVDGKKRGTSPPLTELKLAPGRHTIEIRNASFAPYSDTVILEANAYVKVKHRFR